MTAYGRATDTVNGKEILIEIKSVNSRYFDCNIKISKMYGYIEEKAKKHLIARGISRGKIDVYIGINVIETTGIEVFLDTGYAESYIRALRQLRDEFSLRDDISTMTVAQNREIFTFKREEEDIDKEWAEIQPVLDVAIDNFIAMRENEGEHLKTDLLEKMSRIEQMVNVIEEKSKTYVEAYRQRLEARLNAVLEEKNIQIDEARILTECAIFADRTAIDEELVRLRSHINSYKKIFESNEPVGRKLDFLLQEINREVNTIGSKCNDYDTATVVIEIKSELEKIREQIQNIE